MANEEQLALLRQGADVWNAWMEDNPEVKLDLSGAELPGAQLAGFKLTGAELTNAALWIANLRGAHLSEANLSEANLGNAHLIEADCDKANFSFADLTRAKLQGANLRGATLRYANLTRANLQKANLRGADLESVDLRGANLLGSQLVEAKVGNTHFAALDLSQTIGLDDVIHISPSSISTDTFVLSKGNISEVFLRGCGLSDWEIEFVKLYNPNLSNDERNKILYEAYDLQASQPLQIFPLFISYSHADNEFVDKLGSSLQDKGVRYWRDTHEMKAGRIEKQIDHAIRQNPTVLLVLSEHSVNSDWVEHEVRTGRELEKELSRDVLCPVALDDSWKSSRWPKRLMEQIMEYNILDFSAWQDDSEFEGTFRKLIDGLELFYKKG
jgi:hypothetical protein